MYEATYDGKCGQYSLSFIILRYWVGPANHLTIHKVEIERCAWSETKHVSTESQKMLIQGFRLTKLVGVRRPSPYYHRDNQSTIISRDRRLFLCGAGRNLCITLVSKMYLFHLRDEICCLQTKIWTNNMTECHSHPVSAKKNSKLDLVIHAAQEHHEEGPIQNVIGTPPRLANVLTST